MTGFALHAVARRSARAAVLLAVTAVTLVAISLAARGAAAQPPAPMREFRASWVATVANIDWPSRPGLSAAEQQAELRTILDRAVALHLNAVIFQVRPAADALYASPYEPWSEYLSGTQGVPPSPYYDPLAFAVAEAHARGLELHAWFNPFRARHPSAKSPTVASHISRTHPELVRIYGTQLWLDPGDAAARQYSVRVITDVVRRYDVDGVHIDDYFYPYKERGADGKLLDFPDSATYARYRKAGGTLGREDWRRENVNALVRDLYAAVKKTKPRVQFGVSPFGYWRPGTPVENKGRFDPYTDIYADSKVWLQNGWLDYFVPQLYWQMDSPQPFGALLQWWTTQNPKGRHLWPGMATVNVGGSRAWPADDIARQIAAARAQRGVNGQVHWSEKGLHTSRELMADAVARGRAIDSVCRCTQGDSVLQNARLLSARRDSSVAAIAALYAEPALVPTSPWLDGVTKVAPPAAPQLRVEDEGQAGGKRLVIAPAAKSSAWLWVVQTRRGDQWTTEIIPAARHTVTLARTSADALPDEVAVSGVDRRSVQGRAATWKAPATR